MLRKLLINQNFTMTAHVIQIFGTTTDFHPLWISKDNGEHWVHTEALDEAFNTIVAAGDTVQFAHSLNKDGVTNNITSIQNISPAAFYVAAKKPKKDNNWTGTIKTGNTSNNGVESYSIFYYVTGVTKKQKQDPKLTMSSGG
jgi:hypothetical protein